MSFELLRAHFGSKKSINSQDWEKERKSSKATEKGARKDSLRTFCSPQEFQRRAQMIRAIPVTWNRKLGLLNVSFIDITDYTGLIDDDDE